MGIHNQTGERIEQNHRGCKNGSRNNKEITNADNSGPKKKNLGKKSEVIDAISITNRIEETEKRISGAEDTIEKKLTQQSKKMQNAKSF